MIEVFCDGACRGNGKGGKGGSSTGESAIGVIIYRNGKLIGSYGRPLGSRTSNEAEYEALIYALFWCWTLSSYNDDFNSPIIYTDSLTIYNQVQGIWNCKSQILLPLLSAVNKFREIEFNFNLIHVKRNKVHEADHLANMVLDDILIDPKTLKG